MPAEDQPMPLQTPPVTSAAAQSKDEVNGYLHSQMLNAFSHDLKTPLTTIIGSLQVLTMMYDKLPEEKKKTLIESALTEAFRLDHFITNIIEMRKFQANEIVAHFEPCKLGLLIQDSLSYLGPLRAKGKLDIKQETPDDEMVTDRTLAARVVGLVLHNAFRHGVRKGTNAPPDIEIGYGVKDGNGYVRIRDHGDGIELDKIKTLFQRPAPLHHTDQRSAGAGVGILISQYITRLLDGRIDFANHPDGGATFTLYFKDEK